MFHAEDLTIVTTEHNIAEVIEYLPEFARRYGLDENVLRETVHLLPVEVYAKAQYASHLVAAKLLIGHRDEDDVHLVALALMLQVPVWTNDRDFSNFKRGVYTTATLLKVLGV